MQAETLTRSQPSSGTRCRLLTDTAEEIDHLSDDQRECLENCFTAAETCEWCADACLDDPEGMEKCIRLCRDVADLATTHARFMARGSGHSTQLAEVCAGTCEECAEECERHDADHCRTCADVLRECAEFCRNTTAA